MNPYIFSCFYCSSTLLLAGLFPEKYHCLLIFTYITTTFMWNSAIPIYPVWWSLTCQTENWLTYKRNVRTDLNESWNFKKWRREIVSNEHKSCNGKNFLDMIMAGNQTFWNFAKKNPFGTKAAAYVFLRRILLIRKRNVAHCLLLYFKFKKCSCQKI